MNETTVETIRTDDPFRAAFLMSRKGELILSVRREDSVRFVIKGPELSRQNDLFDSGTVLIYLPHCGRLLSPDHEKDPCSVALPGRERTASFRVDQYLITELKEVYSATHPSKVPEGFILYD